MIHERKIEKIILRVEFDCYGRTAFINVQVDMNTLCNAPRLRKSLDESINDFLENNKPASNDPILLA